MATAGALFMYLADEIGEQARLTQVDLAGAQFFHNHGTPWAVRLFEAITFFRQPIHLGRNRARDSSGIGLPSKVVPVAGLGVRADRRRRA
jgi:hypothetical protein